MTEGNFMWKTIFLIGLLHGSATFDAWTTNRVINALPCQERNPIYRPFAGKPTMYVATNLAVVPIDIWLLSGRRKKLARVVAVVVTGWQMRATVKNMHTYSKWYPLYERWWKEREAAGLPTNWKH
jgi:hypothetical protein